MSKKMSFQDFVEQANHRYHNKFAYDEATFNGSHVKTKITCPEHGDFWQEPRVHLKYLCGCPKCSYVFRGKNFTSTTDEFVEKAKKIHGDKYDYSKTNYVGVKEDIIITCHKKDKFGVEHGDFIQKPNDHLNGEGCKKCSTSHLEQCVMNCLNNLKINYVWQFKNNCILGKQSVDFYLPDYNIAIECQGKQHLIDGSWKNNNLIEINQNDIKKYNALKNNNIRVLYVFPNMLPKTTKQPYKIENTFYLSEIFSFLYDLEYNKIYNDNKLEFFSFLKENIIENEEKIIEDKFFIDNSKKCFVFVSLKKNCENKNIHKENIEKYNTFDVYHIFEDEWINKKDICKSRIKNILGTTTDVIYARKTKICDITNKIAKEFCKKNHLQGGINSKYNFGLYYNNELVSVMTFGAYRKNLGRQNKENEYELLRFCNKLNYTVVGGASKLLIHFINTKKPNKIISYCDRRWSNGKLYEKIGFKFSHYSEPSYFYIINKERKNRFLFRKDQLTKKYGCQITTTEHEFCKANGWNRIYDCGSICYEMTTTACIS